jgi:hypothetical protein
MGSSKYMKYSAYDMQLIVRFVSYTPVVGQVPIKDFRQRTILLICTRIFFFFFFF